jgi:hypothetical protein
MAVSAIMGAVSAGLAALTGGALIGGFLVGGAGTLFTHFLVSTAMGAALNALTPKPKVSISGVGGAGGYSLSGESGSALDHQIIYGEVRAGGVRVYDSSTGSNNTDLNRIVAFAGHEIDSYQAIYYNDEILTLGGIQISSPSRYTLRSVITQYLGTEDQVADQDLISITSGLTDGRWTNEHRLQGIAYVYARFVYNQDAYPNGVPSISALIRGKKVYDPRTGLTVWSNNPALCIRDYLTAEYGLNQPSSRIDDDLVIAAANICDQIVEGEKRYTCNGSFTTGAEPSAIISDLLSSMGGLLWYGQGKWRMKASAWTVPAVTLDEDDLRSGISLSTRHSRRDNFNAVKGTFRGAESDWQVADYPEVSNTAFLAADNGLVNTLDFGLPFTSSSLTAQRIARIALNRNREQLTFSASFGMRAFQVQVGDFVYINNTRFGWVNKSFEVTEWNFGLTEGLDIQVRMTLREISEGVFAGVSGAEFEQNNTTLPSAFLSVAPGISLSARLKEINEQVVGVIDVTLTGGDTGFRDYFEVEYKPSGQEKWIYVGRGSDNNFEIQFIEDGFYDVRVRSVSLLGVRSEYSTISSWYASLFTVPPSNVQNFTGNVVGSALHLSWDAVPDLDLSHYKIRYAAETSGAEYQNAVDLVLKVARPGVSLTVPARTGTYFIRAVDKLGITSVLPSSFVVVTNISQIEDLNVVETITENPSFLGAKDNVVRVTDDGLAYITLDTMNLFDDTSGDFDDALGLFDAGGEGGALATMGTYEFADVIDLGEKYTSRVSVNLKTLFLDYADTFDSATGLFDSREGDFDGDPSKFDLTSVTAQISYTDDDPTGSPAWSAWQNITVSDIPARAIRFRAVLTTSSDKAAPAVTELSALIDMPDRIEAESDITYTGSRVITFPTAFKATPSLGIAATLADGDRYVISGKSRSGFTITTLTGGSTSTNPTTIDYVAKGYGKETA